MAQTKCLSAQASSLPARPNLQYLKKLAKERLKSLRADRPNAKLSDAQLAVAREHNFASWRAIKAHVDEIIANASTMVAEDLSAKIDAFLSAAVSYHTDERPVVLHQAESLLKEEPRIAKTNLLTACVLGDFTTAAEFVERDPQSASASAGPKKWPPILYLAFSRYLKFRPKLEYHFVRIAKLLLDNGADPNSMFVHDGFNETPLYGAAGISNRPKLTKLLLDAGADPDDGGEKSGMESLYHATEHLDNACLKLLLEATPRPDAVSYCLARKLDFEDPAGVRLMLKHGADPNYRTPHGGRGDRVLHAVRRGRSVAILKILHDFGAKLDIADDTGMTPLKLARRLGQKESVKFFLKNGVEDKLDPREKFLEACAAGNAPVAKKLLKADPTLIAKLAPDEARVLPDAAASNHLAAVRLMLALGFDINTKGDWGGTAIHHAAHNGHGAMVKFLIQRGSNLQQKNDYGGDALGISIHGALHGRHRNGIKVVEIVAKAMNVTDMTRYLKAPFEAGDQAIIAALQSIATKKTKSLRVSKNWKPIMDAAFNGDAADIRRLTASGADPNVISSTRHRYRPLHRAIEAKKTMPRGPQHVEAVQALLEAGADPKLRGGMAQLTALELAAMDGPRFIPLLRKSFEPLDIFHACAVADSNRVDELLRTNSANATARDERDWTPLHYASASSLHKDSREHADALVHIVKSLLKAGADPSATYKFEGEWPISVLYHATGQQNNVAVAELLLKVGASPFDGESVYHSADEGHTESLALLEKYADKKKLAAECTNALAGLMHWNRSRAAPWLLEHGADPNQLHHWYGDSALHAAVKNKSRDDVISLLLKYGADPKLKNKDGKSAIDLARKVPRIARLLR